MSLFTSVSHSLSLSSLLRLLILPLHLPTCYAAPSTQQQDPGRLAASQPWRQANCLQQQSSVTMQRLQLRRCYWQKLHWQSSASGRSPVREKHVPERGERERGSARCSVRTIAPRCARQRASSAAQHTGSFIRASFQDCLIN